MHHDKIAVIDFGGQYAHLIATKVRRSGVLAEILQPEDPIDNFHPFKGIIISGSPSLASQEEDSSYTKAIYDLDIPIIGFCFGHQEIAKHYGGSVVHGGREWGKAHLHVDNSHPLFKGLDQTEIVFMSHYDSVSSVGASFQEIGFSKPTADAPEHRFAAIGSDELKRYGFQFHPEVDDTVNGDRMIANFVLDICECKPTWNMDGYLEEQIRNIKTQVGNRSVFLLASGGVDSTVTAVLLGRALNKEQLHLLHIDNGLMRKDESASVVKMYEDLGLGEQLEFYDAGEEFLERLAGLTDPEEKRRAIGDTFISVFQKQAERLGLDQHLLGQGTIYPDTVETGGTKRADTIKTHHNRVPIIDEMIAQGKVVEPLSDLYKTEVRELGEKLGVPHDLIWRHPFPGPGLGVRLLCNDGADDTTGFEEMTDALESFSAKFKLSFLPLPIRSVGVKADLRAYEHPVLITGDRPWEAVLDAAAVITAEVPGINRCIWQIGNEPPTSAHAVRGLATQDRLETLREADHVVMEALHRMDLYRHVWQCPTVLVPVTLGDQAGELVVLRPVKSERAMTATPVELPMELLKNLKETILELEGVGSLAVDVTSKPPGTIEWE